MVQVSEDKQSEEKRSEESGPQTVRSCRGTGMVDIEKLPKRTAMSVIIVYPDSEEEFSVMLYRGEIEEFVKNSGAKVVRILDFTNGKELWKCPGS